MDPVWEINKFATEGCMPNLTLYLDIDPEIALSRIKENGLREVNRLDLESLQFHQRVREGYLKVAEKFPERIVALDATADPASLAMQAWEHVEKKLSTL